MARLPSILGFRGLPRVSCLVTLHSPLHLNQVQLQMPPGLVARCSRLRPHHNSIVCCLRISSCLRLCLGFHQHLVARADLAPDHKAICHAAGRVAQVKNRAAEERRNDNRHCQEQSPSAHANRRTEEQQCYETDERDEGGGCPCGEENLFVETGQLLVRLDGQEKPCSLMSSHTVMSGCLSTNLDTLLCAASRLSTPVRPSPISLRRRDSCLETQGFRDSSRLSSTAHNSQFDKSFGSSL